MSELNRVDTALLEVVAGMKDGRAEGAFNIRKDSGCAGRVNTENVTITTKTDKPGIDIRFVPGCRDSCHIPVIITESGLRETVYNDFYVGEGDGNGKNVMNPTTVAYLEEGASMQMDMSQIGGIDSTRRDTRIVCGKDADVVITERLLTHGGQRAESDMTIELNGENARGRVISRSVAKNGSVQVFRPCVVGNAKCFGHVQCDSIIMDEAKIRSVPEIAANDLDAQLIHEAANGRIAGDQLLKLETLGLTEEEAEDRILKGFLA